MPLILLNNWRLIAAILVIAATFYAGYHTRGAFDQIAADKLLQEQREINAKAQDDLNAKATKVEADLAAERVKSSDLNKRWSKINAQKHTSCKLSAPTLQLLQDATANKNNNAR